MIGANFRTKATSTSFMEKDKVKDDQSTKEFKPMQCEEVTDNEFKAFAANETTENLDMKIGSEVTQSTLIDNENKLNEVAKSEPKQALAKAEMAMVTSTEEDGSGNKVLLKNEKTVTSNEVLTQNEEADNELKTASLIGNGHKSYNYFECSGTSSPTAATWSVKEMKGKKRKIEQLVEATSLASNGNDDINDSNYLNRLVVKEEQSLTSLKSAHYETELDSFSSPSAHNSQTMLQKCSKISSNNIDEGLHSSKSDDQELMKDASLLHNFKTLLENSAKKQPLEDNLELSKNSTPHAFCLIPNEKDSQHLSDYNNLLAQNIEMFLVDVKNQNEVNYVTTEKLLDTNEKRIGLRCIHCVNEQQHFYGAKFFPSNIASLSSGLGTICARHILAEKCPHVPLSLVEQLRESKKTTQSQTRKRGMSLDFYCKVILNKNLKLVNFKREQQNLLIKTPCNHGGQRIDVEHGKTQKEKAHLKTIASQPFQPSAIENFWACKYCSTVPYPWRVSGSVVYSETTPPSNILVEKHLALCQGKRALTIPRTASIQILDDDYKRIRIKWNSSNEGTSDSLDEFSREGKELVAAADKDLTTDFAYFTFLQLKITSLTKADGSRGSCQVGYPGVACVHCSGMPNERKFFYTSSDHLRNSFSHIPSHLLECTMCPDDVKSKLESLKSIRNKQKSQLKVGSHKMFIDRVWTRMHGSLTLRMDGKIQHGDLSCKSKMIKENARDLKEENETAYLNSMLTTNDDSVISSSDHASNGATELISIQDKHLVTDFTYFTMQQMIPCHLKASGNGARSAFEVGFAGLECKHCSNTANPRRFFYRTSDILGGNYAHIPNHLLICKSCPQDVKAALEAKKTYHLQQKMKLGRGSQRIFFGRVWERLHGTKVSSL